MVTITVSVSDGLIARSPVSRFMEIIIVYNLIYRLEAGRSLFVTEGTEYVSYFEELNAETRGGGR